MSKLLNGVLISFFVLFCVSLVFAGNHHRSSNHMSFQRPAHRVQSTFRRPLFTRSFNHSHHFAPKRHSSIVRPRFGISIYNTRPLYVVPQPLYFAPQTIYTVPRYNYVQPYCGHNQIRFYGRR